MRISDYKAVLVLFLSAVLLLACGIVGLDDYYWDDESRPDPTLSFSVDSGFFTSAFELKLSTQLGNAEIYYTLDGSPPQKGVYSITYGGDISTSTAGTLKEYTGGILYEEPIAIEATTMVKVLVYSNGFPVGDIYSNTYFINESTTLPIFSISVDPADFFDDLTGIYVKGNNPTNVVRQDYESVPPFNFMQDWEREISFEYFDENRDLMLETNAGVKVFGGWSRKWNDQKSLAIYARKKYGFGFFPYPFFGSELLDDNGVNITQFKSLLLRTSGDDWWRTMIRDASLQETLEGMDVDRQAYKPSIVFVNGEYYGVHNIREKINEDYLASHYPDISPDEVDILESYNSRIVEGTNADFLALVDYVQNNNLSITANYEYVQTKIDLSNFIDYFASQIFFNNTDWPISNIKYWKPQGVGGKWRWLTYDLDGSFGGKEWDTSGADDFDHDTINWVLAEDGSTDSATLFTALMNNADFKDAFKTRFNYLLSNNFAVDNIEGIIDGNKAIMDLEYERHRERWDNLWLYDDMMTTFRGFASPRHSYVSGTLIPAYFP